MAYERKVVSELLEGLKGGPAVMQVVSGPRQVGKTTAAEQVARQLGWPVVFEGADVYPGPGPEWIETHWARARGMTGKQVLLVLDEVQKVAGWSETVKRLWDEDRRVGKRLGVILLGSSAMQLQQGMRESLAGRFFLHRCMHWSFSECREAFGWNLDKWLYFGGYPGAAAFANSEEKWRRYVADSLIEVAIARDVLQLQTVNKPALLRNLFGLGTAFPAQILSYNKMLGQLLDAGNTTTLAHYVKLLETAFLLSGLEQFHAGQSRKRGSSPKLIFWNNALITASGTRALKTAREDGPWWGRLVENAAGAHLLNSLPRETYSLTYWRQGHDEVDFVVQSGIQIWGLEIKSGRPRRRSGLAAFKKAYPQANVLIIGSGGIPLDEFFGSDPARLLT